MESRTNHVEEREVLLLSHDVRKLPPLVVGGIDSGGLQSEDDGKCEKRDMEERRERTNVVSAGVEKDDRAFGSGL